MKNCPQQHSYQRKKTWLTRLPLQRFSHPDIVAGIPPRPEPEGRDQLPSGHAVYTFKQDWQVELDDWGCKAILAIARGLVSIRHALHLEISADLCIFLTAGHFHPAPARTSHLHDGTEPELAGARQELLAQPILVPEKRTTANS